MWSELSRSRHASDHYARSSAEHMKHLYHTIICSALLLCSQATTLNAQSGDPDPCENVLEIEFIGDGASNIQWTLYEQGTDAVVQADGGIFMANGATGFGFCVLNGCYYLVVTDDVGDGIIGGGYLLRTVVPDTQRIIDNRNNFTTGFTSQIANGQGFCLPLGTDRLIATSCDKLWWVNNEYIVANDNPAVTAQFGVTNASSGYQIWFFDPNGGYTFRRTQNHNTPNGFTLSATRACHFKINSWSGNQLAQGELYNVRVRGRVAGNFLEWGPACRFAIDPALAQCPPTQLITSTVDPQQLSCGAWRTFPSTQSKLYAWARPGANRYQFEFSNPDDAFLLVKTTTTNVVTLNWTANPLLDDHVYFVRVRMSRNGGLSYCPWGEYCNVTIWNGPAQGGQRHMAAAGSASAAPAPKLELYPNPNQGDQLFLRIDQVKQGLGTVSVDILDTFGKRVSSSTVAASEGVVNTVIDLRGELAAGMYLVNVTAGNDTFTERLVIQP